MFYFNHNLSSEIPYRHRRRWGKFHSHQAPPRMGRGDGHLFFDLLPGGKEPAWRCRWVTQGINKADKSTLCPFYIVTWRFKHPHLQVPVSNIHFGPCARIGCMEHKAACFSEQSMPCALEFHVQVVRAPALYKRSWWTKQAASGIGKQCSMETKLLSPPNSISLIINFHPKAH